MVHEGVPETLLNRPRLQQLAISESVTLTPEVPVVTFISRNLEPMRGFPTFMNALPELQKCHPSVQVVIVGGDDVSYSNAPEDGRSWRQVLLEELGDRIDRSGFIYLAASPMSNCRSSTGAATCTYTYQKHLC